MKVSYRDLQAVRERHRNKKIVLCTGGFDLTHAGHLLFFESCKQYGDILVVGIASDAIRRQERGSSRPILNEHLRLAMVDGLKHVDYSFLLTKLALPHEYPHQPLADIFQLLRPDTYVINNEVSGLEDKRTFIESFGVKFIVLPRLCPPEFEKISTTSIIEKIKQLKEYEI